jgi:multisubunit Na+/H+ antiporter MnhB subunit
MIGKKGHGGNYLAMHPLSGHYDSFLVLIRVLFAVILNVLLEIYQRDTRHLGKFNFDVIVAAIVGFNTDLRNYFAPTLDYLHQANLLTQENFDRLLHPDNNFLLTARGYAILVGIHGYLVTQAVFNRLTECAQGENPEQLQGNMLRDYY